MTMVPIIVRTILYNYRRGKSVASVQNIQDQTGRKEILAQGPSKDSETGCPKLAIFNF